MFAPLSKIGSLALSPTSLAPPPPLEPKGGGQYWLGGGAGLGSQFKLLERKRESPAICVNFPTYVQVKYWKYLSTFRLSLTCSLKELGINHGKTDKSINNVRLWPSFWDVKLTMSNNGFNYWDDQSIESIQPLIFLNDHSTIVDQDPYCESILWHLSIDQTLIIWHP